MIQIQKGYVWLEGDNKDQSLDSRRYGPVPEDYIRGVATHICRRHKTDKFPNLKDFGWESIYGCDLTNKVLDPVKDAEYIKQHAAQIKREYVFCIFFSTFHPVLIVASLAP